MLLNMPVALGSFGALAAHSKVFQWEKVAGAAYYRGRITHNSQVTHFRTSATRIMVREGEILTIKAISADSVLLKILTPQGVPDVAPGPGIAAAQLSVVRPTTASVVSQDEPMPVEGTGVDEAYRLQTSVSAGLGIGIEQLKLTGDAKLNNSTRILGTGVKGSGRWESGPDSWQVFLDGFIHKFVVSTFSNPEAAAQSERKLQRLRLESGFVFERSFGLLTAGGGAGVAVLEGPLLQVDYDLVSEHFVQERSVLPFGMVVLTLPYSASAALNLAFSSSLPIVASGVTQKGLLELTKSLNGNIFFSLALVVRQEEIQRDIHCPDNVLCAKAAKMSSDLTYGLLNAGTRF